MNGRLIKRIDQILVMEGQEGKRRLARVLALRSGTQMLDRYMNGMSEPSRHQQFLLAKEAGFSESEALTLASECDQARETAS